MYSMIKNNLFTSTMFCIGIFILSGCIHSPKESPSDQDIPEQEFPPSSNAMIQFAEADTTASVDISFDNDTLALKQDDISSLSMVSRIWDNLGALQKQSDSLSALISVTDTSTLDENSHSDNGLFQVSESDQQRQTRHQRTVKRALSHLNENDNNPAATISAPEEVEPDLMYNYSDRRMITCMFSRKTRIKDKASISVVLLEDATINGRTYEDGSAITVSASFVGDRLQLRSTDPPGLEAYDLGMQKGLGFTGDNNGGQVLANITSSIVNTIPGVSIKLPQKAESVIVPEGYIFYMATTPDILIN